MARTTDKSTGNGHPVSQQPAPETNADSPLVPGGIDPARVSMSGSLATFQGLIEWALQMQQQQAKSLDAWRQALDAALREVDNASDLPTLMSVPPKLANLQLNLSMQQLGESMALLVESEMNLASRMLDYATSAMQSTLATSVLSPASAFSASGSPLAPLTQLQSQWLAATQEWMTGTDAAINR